MKNKFSIRLALAGLFICAASALASAQGGYRYDSIALLDTGRPANSATIRVCSSGSTGTPCTPTASIFTDSGLSVSLANPFTSDTLGNYGFYAACGKYDVQISGSGLTTRTMKDQQVGPCNPGIPAPGPIGGTTPNTGNFTTVTATSIPTAGPIGGTTPGTGNFTTLTATSIPVPGPIGGTTPNTGAFTTISTTGNATVKRVVVSGSTPTCTVTGAGTGGACAVAGGTDTAGFIQLTTGTSPSATGSITLTYSSAFSVGSVCVGQLLNNALSWSSRATATSSATVSTTTWAWIWDNNGVALTGSSSTGYDFSYVCFGR